VPFSETTSWSFIRHHFDQAQSVGFLGDGEVRVAVIDDGIQCSLADISCGTGVDVTGEGFDPNVDGGHTPSHETRIASIIAAAVGNGLGVKGGAPYVSLHSVRAFGTDSLSCQDMAQALDVAAAYWELDADIINLSWGYYQGAYLGQCETLLSNAVAGAVAGNDAIVVAAPGDNGGPVAFPANLPQALAVSGLQMSPYGLVTIAPLSNRGPEVDIAAGGWNIASLDRTGSVSTASGTSYAVPHVAAALALLHAQRLDVVGCKPSAGDAKAVLFNNTHLPDAYPHPSLYGAGVLDVHAALVSGWLEGQQECPHEVPGEW
jgi:subtilisin family serine protease